MKACAFTLALVGALGGVAHAQDQNAEQALLQVELQRLAQAQHVRFRAMLILSMANQLSTLRLAPDQARSDGALPSVLSIAADGLHLSAGDNTGMTLEHRSWHASNIKPTDLARIEQGYKVHLQALDRVDGRDALPLRFDPVDRWRYGTTLWVDRSTGLVLKTEVRGMEGQPLAQAMLAQLEILGQDQASAHSASPQHLPSAPQRWQIKGLPDGFAVLGAAPDAQGEQLLVGDGVATVSVFVEPIHDGQGVQRGHQQRGLLATHAEVRGDYQLIAVGAVPAATIERILNGLSPAD